MIVNNVGSDKWPHSVTSQADTALFPSSTLTNSDCVPVISKAPLLKSLTLNLTWKSVGKINQFMPNRISHRHQLKQSISALRDVGWYFSFLFKFQETLL